MSSRHCFPLAMSTSKAISHLTAVFRADRPEVQSERCLVRTPPSNFGLFPWFPNHHHSASSGPFLQQIQQSKALIVNHTTPCCGNPAKLPQGKASWTGQHFRTIQWTLHPPVYLNSSIFISRISPWLLSMLIYSQFSGSFPSQ